MLIRHQFVSKILAKIYSAVGNSTMILGKIMKMMPLSFLYKAGQGWTDCLTWYFNILSIFFLPEPILSLIGIAHFVKRLIAA